VTSNEDGGRGWNIDTADVTAGGRMVSGITEEQDDCIGSRISKKIINRWKHEENVFMRENA
jgi:hypothetical protein